MAQVVFDFPPTVFSALRKSPEEFAAEMRLAAAMERSGGRIPLTYTSLATLP